MLSLVLEPLISVRSSQPPVQQSSAAVVPPWLLIVKSSTYFLNLKCSSNPSIFHGGRANVSNLLNVLDWTTSATALVIVFLGWSP
jgi:hypothetical protein